MNKGPRCYHPQQTMVSSNMGCEWVAKASSSCLAAYGSGRMRFEGVRTASSTAMSGARATMPWISS